MQIAELFGWTKAGSKIYDDYGSLNYDVPEEWGMKNMKNNYRYRSPGIEVIKYPMQDVIIVGCFGEMM